LVAVVSRVVDWFWQLSAARALHASGSAPSPRVLELVSRAALAQEAAARTLRPAEPFAQPGNQALACELSREAIHWALLAHAASSSSAPPSAGDGATPAADDLPGLLERVDGALLARAAGSEAALAELRTRLGGTSYLQFAELAPGEQSKLAQRLESFCQGLLEPLSGRRRQLERIWVKRAVHVLTLVGVLGVALWSIQTLSLGRERKNDLSRFATWQASSAHPAGGCQSPQQSCSGGENYFFHTAEQNEPWIVFDLGKERHVSGVEIDNRLDCCFERANSMVVEVSSDRKKWKQVARSTAEFSTFRRSFSTVKTRYLRIRIPQPKAILHLSRVRIFP
jgi:hypothetical protein